jgi:alpha-methylacyl-CoA racemase
VASVFATKTRDEWATVFEGRPACVTPVLTLGESATHPHLVSRGTITDVGGVAQPAPAPRFSRTRAELTEPAWSLADWGLSAEDLAALDVQ